MSGRIKKNRQRFKKTDPSLKRQYFPETGLRKQKKTISSWSQETSKRTGGRIADPEKKIRAAAAGTRASTAAQVRPRTLSEARIWG